MEVRQGIHAPRMPGDFAVVDVVLTILAAWGIARYFKWNVCIVILCLFILGIIVHWYLDIPTRLNVLLGLASDK
jgi:hypothetical protein